MGLKPILVPLILMFLLFLRANSEEEVVKQALVMFVEKLAQGNVKNVHRDPNFGWKLTSDPCTDKWHGVICHSDNKTVKSIVLESSNLSGVFDANSLCTAKSLMVLSLKNNSLHGLVSEEIGKCKSLTHLYLSGNHFSGQLPTSVSELKNLKRLHVSDNSFSGEIPDMGNVSGLISFLAENNNFSGGVPADFGFSNLVAFNVSNNNLHGQFPDVRGKFHADSFYGNPGLCGKPLPNACPPPPPPPPPPRPREKKGENSALKDLFLYSGYIILGIMVLLFFLLKLLSKFKTKRKALDDEKKEKGEETSGDYSKPKSNETSNSNGSKSSFIGVRSEYSMSLSSFESEMASTGLVVLSSSSEFEALRFEDLLSAPAELVRRGNHGSLYKVMLSNDVLLAVKRVKDLGISKKDFERRMKLIAQVKHPSVLKPLAYYCSYQEKLLAYEYLQNGSLYLMLWGSQSGGNSFDWESRVNVAANIAEALAHMHEELQESGIAHGNLKSSNILFDRNMCPCISEYGIMVAENQDQHTLSHTKSLRNTNLAFKADTYAFGVILLELLTGRVVKNDGFDIAEWVNAVVREEWTVEVFDKSLIKHGACEERMVRLLQVALNCINPSPKDRPSLSQVAMVTKALKEDEEKSLSFEV